VLIFEPAKQAGKKWEQSKKSNFFLSSAQIKLFSLIEVSLHTSAIWQVDTISIKIFLFFQNAHAGDGQICSSEYYMLTPYTCV